MLCFKDFNPNRKFKVWVSEELGDWVPDCVDTEEVWEEKSETEKTKEENVPVGEQPVNPEQRNQEGEGLSVDVGACKGDGASGYEPVHSPRGTVVFSKLWKRDNFRRP
ncbi:hypothetical protein Hanom_Chr15g01390901 [Helianthus anomalus]